MTPRDSSSNIEIIISDYQKNKIQGGSWKFLEEYSSLEGLSLFKQHFQVH